MIGQGSMGMEQSVSSRDIYSRQIMIKEIGEEGQSRLAGTSVLVVGCGGLGSPVLYYLTAMGIGHLGLCDGDFVKPSNLNRQVLFTFDDIGKPKAYTAKEHLTALNPKLKTTIYDKPINQQLAEKIIMEYDIIVDCLDNFETRFIINDVCILSGKPLVHAGVGEFFGQLMTILPGKSPCLRCLFPNGIRKRKQNGNQEINEPVTGVIGPVPGVMGSLQALEAAKYVLGLPVCSDGLLTYDGITASFEKVELNRAKNCICSKNEVN